MPSLLELLTLADWVLLGVLLVVSIVEVRTGTIPNPLVLGCLIAWLAVTAFTGAWSSALPGALLAFGAATFLWSKDYLGGGGAKAMLPIGGLLGLVGAAAVTALALGYLAVHYRRQGTSSVAFTPRVAVMCGLFVGGRVAYATYIA